MVESHLKCLPLALLLLVSIASSLYAEDRSPALGAAVNEQLLSNWFGRSRPEISCELKVKEKYEFYDIDGASFEELRQQMKKNGTKWGDGKIYAALTTWDIKYHYEYLFKDGICSIRSVNTDVAIVYHLPRVKLSAREPTSLTEGWTKYVQRLKQHEFGHKDLALKTAAEINETLTALDGFKSSADLDLAAKMAVQAKLKHLDEIQVQYDDDTHHGVSQGAVLPND